MRALLLLTVVFIIAVIIDFYLIKKWAEYKKLSKENKQSGNIKKGLELFKTLFIDAVFLKSITSASSSIKQLLHFPILFIFGLIVIGVIQLRLNIWASGVICLIFAMLGFAINYGSLEVHNENNFDDKRDFERITYILKRPKIILWGIVFLLLIFSIYATARGNRPPNIIRLGEIAWVTSVALGVVTIFWEQLIGIRNIFSSLYTKVSKHQREILIVTLILLLGGFLRTYMLAEHPYPWSGDEMSIGSNGRQILNGEKSNLFETGWAAQPYWSFLPTAITIKIFGDNVNAIRLASAIPGILAILFTYLVAREMFNPTIAGISAAFLATFPYHLHFSRIGVNNIIDSLMSALTFWLIVKAIKKNDIRLFYLAGAAAGLCVYTYAGTKLVPFLGFFILLFYLRLNMTLKVKASYLIVFVVATVIGVSPQLANSSQNMGILVGRLNAESIFLSGWLEEQVINTGKPALEIIFNQFIKNFLVFIALPTDGTFFFETSQPYLTVLGSAFFLLGMTYAWKNTSKTNLFVILFWYFAGVIIGGALTKGAPANTRMLMSSPPTAIFIGLGIFLFVETIKKSITISVKSTRNILGLILCILLIPNIYFYMVKLKNDFYFQTIGGEFTMEVGFTIKNKYPEYQTFILGSPIFSDFPTFEFINPGRKLTDLNDSGLSDLILEKNQKYAFFATSNNSQTLNKIMKKYPGGEHGFFYRIPNEHEVLYEYYVLEYK